MRGLSAVRRAGALLLALGLWLGLTGKAAAQTPQKIAPDSAIVTGAS